MALPQQKFREIVFQLLFSSEFVEIEEEMIAFMMQQLAVTKKVVREAEAKRKAIIERLPEIDEMIKSFSFAYEPERVGRVERSVLRLSIYEICFEELPPKVAIAEAIRLTRKFAAAEGGSFVNAVLDALYQSREKDGKSAPISEE